MNTLLEIQAALKAPKSNRNTFGNYNYRSAEDILEAVKPLLLQHGATLTLSDEIVEVGGRIYVKATAAFIGNSATVEVTAYAREAETKKGMDDSQITGTASSYARKYALNGLFLIDDTKDADTDAYVRQTGGGKKATQERIKEPAKWGSLDERDEAVEEIKKLLAAAGKTEAGLLGYLGLEDIKHINKDQYNEWRAKLGGTK